MSVAAMRVLWVSENYYPSRGGMAESCDRIVYNLRQSGLEIDIIHLYARAKHFREVEEQGGLTFIFPQEDDLAHTLNRVWNFLESRAKKYTYTHLVAFGGYLPLTAAPLYAAWLSLPLITCIRGNDFDTAIFYPQRRAVLQDALLASQMVCSVSQDKIFKINQLYPEVRTQYVPNGIDLENWGLLASDEEKAARIKKEISPEAKPILGIFGQLKAKKGVVFFLKALSRAGLHTQVHVLFVGDLSPDVDEMLQNHPGHFTYSHLGFMERYALLPYYAACSLIAIPSFYDGLPNVLLEAGGLGIPIMASRVAGMADVLEDKKTGLLFDAGDLDDAAQTLREWKNMSQEERTSLGQSLQKLVREEYTHTLESMRYLNIFQNIV